MPSRDRIVNRYVRQYNEKKKAKERRKLVMLPIKLVFGIACVGVLAYFVVQVFLAFNTPMTTATALSTVVNDEFSIVGYFVREETVLEADYDGILVYTVDEGDKVARFGEYAAVYENSGAAELKATATRLDENIQFLQSALDSSMDTSGVMNLSSYIYEGLYDTSELADAEAFTLISDYVSALKSNIITRELTNTPVEEIQSMITSLESQRDRLNELIGDSETTLTTSESGFFTSPVDGYENVFDVNALDELTPSSFRSLLNQNASVTDRQVGRLVTSFTWYFVSNLRVDVASALTSGSYVNLRFDAMGDDLVRVRVESISAAEDGEVTVVFSSDQYMEELVNLRKQSASVVMATYEGLKVPKDAVRVDEEGNLGVYVITGMYSEFKEIDVLYETEDYYIVDTDPTTTRSLLVYDLIIVNGKGLANGKVIQ